jgi:type IV secretion system protein VirB9
MTRREVGFGGLSHLDLPVANSFREQRKMDQKMISLRKRAIVFLLFLGMLLPLPPSPLEARDGARVVKYAKEDVIPVRAKLRYSTLLVLPENEEILDFTTGDKEFWIINGAHNLCYIHPAQAGIRSNLNLITASGRVYSFLLVEISADAKAEPDLKLFIEPKESSGATSLQGYVRASDAEAYKKELETLRAETDTQIRAAEAAANESVNRYRKEYAGKLQFDYSLDADAKREPFLVSAIYHDDAFTYLRSAAREKPALYEVKDGKPSLVEFQFENGVYVASKIIDNGYLMIGKKKLAFSRQIPGR